MCYLESQTLECPIDSVETWSIEMQWKLSPLKCLFFLKCLLPLEGFYIARLLSTIDLCFFGRLQCVCSITLTPNCRVITIGTSLCVITGPVNSFELNNLKEWKNKHVFLREKAHPVWLKSRPHQTAIQKQYPRLWQLLPDKMIIWKLFWSSSVEIKESIDYFFRRLSRFLRGFPSRQLFSPEVIHRWPTWIFIWPKKNKKCKTERKRKNH